MSSEHPKPRRIAAASRCQSLPRRMSANVAPAQRKKRNGSSVASIILQIINIPPRLSIFSTHHFHSTVLPTLAPPEKPQVSLSPPQAIAAATIASLPPSSFHSQIILTFTNLRPPPMTHSPTPCHAPIKHPTSFFSPSCGATIRLLSLT